MNFLDQGVVNEWAPISGGFQQLNVESSGDLDSFSPGCVSMASWEESKQIDGGFRDVQFQTVATENLAARDDNFGFQHDDFARTVSKNAVFDDIPPPTYNLEIDALDLTLFPDLFPGMNDVSSQLLPATDEDQSALRNNEHSFNPFSTELQIDPDVGTSFDQGFPASIFSISRTEAGKGILPLLLTGTFDPLTSVVAGLDPVVFAPEPSQKASAPLALKHVAELPDYFSTTTETGLARQLHPTQISHDLRLTLVGDSGGFRRADDFMVSPLRKKK